ncbi:hypothetical protein S40285_03431, partial [Stachybotrys chlorohalonatus IBT 40285]
SCQPSIFFLRIFCRPTQLTRFQDPTLSESDGQAAQDTVMNASGSDGADKDSGIDSATVYGTRSRNRTGNPRPNYAEDKDIDADVYDYYHDKKDSDAPPKKSSRQSNAAAGGNDAPRGATSSRKSGAGVVNDDAKAAAAQNGSKEQNSSNGTANASQASQATGAAQSSRKRKATSQQAGGGAATSKKAGNANANANTNASSAQTTGFVWPESNMLTFEDSKARPVDGRMVADDGTVLQPNDHVYLVCEPPGEPYYLGRIMEFLHPQNDNTRPVDAVRINWYYRPKDIGRKAPDTRMVFATMHSDISPLTALRGKCQIRHRVDIEKMDDYRRAPDSFWFEKLYDRYIQKNYDVVPTMAIVNVPRSVKKVLDERWKYVLIEQGRSKDLTSAVKLCKRCSAYCASNDSVDCAVCRNTYHMNCVRPPLLKKPSRGFAWSCAACSRAQERKLEARHTGHVVDTDLEEDELLDEDEDDTQTVNARRAILADDDNSHHQGTAEQIYHASLWPYRYLGVHCKPEDALDYDDRIYPRASTRIGPRHQAMVGPWPGQPIQYVKPLETKKNGKKEPKLSKEAQAAQEAEKARREQRPKWVQDEPPGYIARGGDYDESDPNCTATLIYKPPPPNVISPEAVKEYMTDASRLAKKLNLPERSTNLQDVALETLFRCDLDPKTALSNLRETDRIEFKEPALTPAEQKKFEEGVSKFGSELHLVMKHVKTLTPGEVVRYYYTWKKTERGKQIWGNFAGRKGKKEAKRAESAASKLADDVADNDDDSAFDTDKAIEKKRTFLCQFCNTTSSRQWRRAPHAATGITSESGAKAAGKDKSNQVVSALCRRCAELWRRYGIRYEDIEDVAKKVQSGGRAWKRKQDEDLLKELQTAQELGLMTPDRASTPSVSAPPSVNQEPPRKKLKSAPDKEADNGSSDGGSASGAVVTTKKKDKEREKDKEKDRVVETAPAIPEVPKPRMLPCAICSQMEPLGDQLLSCRECRLTVHRNCYGILDHRTHAKWICDMCSNDKSPQLSIDYRCVLCPVEQTDHDFVEQPKLTHHKKKLSEKDRERERLEVLQAKKAVDHYRKRQEEMNRPLNPREPLKRTADNNWVHPTCAVWTPEVKFGNAKAMEPSEGIPSIPRSRYDEVCTACNKVQGACVPCYQCRTPYHVECARQHGHLLGFEITPVKNSRKDQSNIVTLNGETGTMSAVISCINHPPGKTAIHLMHDPVEDSGLNVLQFFVQNYKQADLTLTGTVRKANLMTMAAKMSGAPATSSSQPGTNGTAGTLRNGESTTAASGIPETGEKVCITCGIDVSPRWWPIDNTQERELTNGHYGMIGCEAQKFVEQRKFQCHKCHKTNRTPQPHAQRPWTGASEVSPRPSLPEPGVAAAAISLRSPSLPPHAEHRDGRTGAPPWPHHVPTNTAATVVQAPSHPSPLTAMAPRPSAGTMGYPAAPLPARSSFNDWGHRPGSQHGSPPRILNGPSAPLHNGAPMTGLSSLRPPALSGPPPGPGAHQHVHSSQPYANGLPPSPRRLSGPSAPPPYTPPYHNSGHGPPPLAPSHGMSNGTSSARSDAFSHNLHPQRSAVYSGPHVSPPGSRNGLPGTQDSQPPLPAHGVRATEGRLDGRLDGRPDARLDGRLEGRPSSGASASPSLRNLLS